ncbi:hypothetical protein V6N13_143594 [Hibiscus sabdariffa]|uniref:Uncharacterized protein n=1 Tax=Hibiscus sabdariffa TaxID=183260 RepID=A0ABR2FHV5_9ROSI
MRPTRNLWPQLQARSTRTKKEVGPLYHQLHHSREPGPMPYIEVYSPSLVTFPAKNLSSQGFSYVIPQLSSPNYRTTGESLELDS